MAGWMILLLFCVLQIVGGLAGLWLLAALDGCWWPFGPRYHYVGVMDGAENRPTERADSKRGTDSVQDMVRGTRHDDKQGLDRAYPRLQRPPAEDGRGGEGAAAAEHRGVGSSEISGVQGTRASAGEGGFRAELERRAADAGFRR